MRKFGILLFILTIFAPPMGRAQSIFESCAKRYAELTGKVKEHLPVTPVVPLIRSRGENLKELELVQVTDIFPQTVTLKTGRRVSDTRVKVDAKSMKRFKDHFDALWQARVDSGLIPSWELKEYRKWLEAQTNSQGPYPPVNAKELYEDYVAVKAADGDAGHISEYFDFKFLEYLEKVKFARPESVEEYLSSIDKRYIPHLAKAAVKRTKKVLTGFYAGAAGATFLIVSGLPAELANSLFSPLVQPIKDYLKNNTKKVGEKGAEFISDWGSLFKGGEEKYVSTLRSFRIENYWFEQKSLNSVSREEAVAHLDNYLAKTTLLLPQFHKLVLSEQSDFEEKWNKRLEDSKQPIFVLDAAHQQNHLALSNLKAEVEKRSPPTPTASEQERITEISQNLESTEEYMAAILADWLFYRQVRGPDNPLDPGLDRSFKHVYDQYLRTMSVDRLAKAIAKRNQAHASLLETYSKKAAGTKVDPASFKEKKPEDQINEAVPSTPK